MLVDDVLRLLRRALPWYFPLDVEVGGGRFFMCRRCCLLVVWQFAARRGGLGNGVAAAHDEGVGSGLAGCNRVYGGVVEFE